jgi:hypothetical protein
MLRIRLGKQSKDRDLCLSAASPAIALISDSLTFRIGDTNALKANLRPASNAARVTTLGLLPKANA